MHHKKIDGQLRNDVKSAVTAGSNPLLVVREMLEANPFLLIDGQLNLVRRALVKIGLIHENGNPHFGGIRFPNAKAVKNSFSPEQMALAFSDRFREPTLGIVPDTNFSLILKFLNGNRFPNQQPVSLHPPFQEPDGKDATVTSWTPVIMDGTKGPSGRNQTLPASVALSQFVEEQRRERIEFSPLLDGMDRMRYATLLLLATARGNTFSDLPDTKSATILDADPALNLDPTTERGIPVGRVVEPDNEWYNEKGAAHFRMNRNSFGGYAGYGGHRMRDVIVGEKIS